MFMEEDKDLGIHVVRGDYRVFNVRAKLQLSVYYS